MEAAAKDLASALAPSNKLGNNSWIWRLRYCWLNLILVRLLKKKVKQVQISFVPDSLRQITDP